MVVTLKKKKPEHLDLGISENVCFWIIYSPVKYSTRQRQTTFTVNWGSFRSVLSSQVDTAVSGFSNDFEKEHQSIFIHYGVNIDCLGNQLQYTATDSSSLCQGKKTRVGRKTLIQSLAKKKHWNIFCYFKFSSPHDIKYFYELK